MNSLDNMLEDIKKVSKRAAQESPPKPKIIQPMKKAAHAPLRERDFNRQALRLIMILRSMPRIN